MLILYSLWANATPLEGCIAGLAADCEAFFLQEAPQLAALVSLEQTLYPWQLTPLRTALQQHLALTATEDVRKRLSCTHPAPACLADWQVPEGFAQNAAAKELVGHTLQTPADVAEVAQWIAAKRARFVAIVAHDDTPMPFVLTHVSNGDGKRLGFAISNHAGQVLVPLDEAGVARVQLAGESKIQEIGQGERLRAPFVPTLVLPDATPHSAWKLRSSEGRIVDVEAWLEKGYATRLGERVVQSGKSFYVQLEDDLVVAVDANGRGGRYSFVSANH